MKNQDLELLNNTKFLVKKEKEYTIQILKNLIEIERKKLFVELGFTSLHGYCVEVLGYASSEAYLRISAMRIMRDFPLVQNNIEKGKLSLTAVGELQMQIVKKEKEEGIKIPKEIKIKLLKEIEGKSTRASQAIVKAELKIEEKIKASDFVLNEESVKMLKQLATKMEIQDLNVLVQMLAKEKNERLIEDKQVKRNSPALEKIAKPNTRDCTLHPREKITRYIPLKIRRLVFIRANYQCEKCKSKKYLNLDHIRPFSLGGIHSLENIRVLCSGCNQRERVKFFGENYQKHFPAENFLPRAFR